MGVIYADQRTAKRLVKDWGCKRGENDYIRIPADLIEQALSGSSFVHNLGFLSGGRTGSLEMLVLCDELAGWSNQMVASLQVNDETICVDAIKRAVANNDFLTDSHTQGRFLTQSWYPDLLERCDAGACMEAGSRDLRTRIRAKISALLN